MTLNKEKVQRFQFLIVAAILLLILFFLSKPFVAHVKSERDKVIAKTRTKTLNLLLPANMEDLLQLSLNPKRRGISENYVNYYAKVVEYLPQFAGGHALNGFCFYHKKDHVKAIESYKKSIDLNPHNFWSYYNLGTILFKNQQYESAQKILQFAVKQDPEMTMKSIYTSHIYQQIIPSAQAMKYDFNQELRKGYQNSYQMLILSSYRLNQFDKMGAFAKEALGRNLNYDAITSTLNNQEEMLANLQHIGLKVF